jgi:N-methylhydantoinase A
VKAKRAANVSRKAPPPARGRRTIYDSALGKQVAAPVYWRFDMKLGSAINGPAIIAEDETSTIVGANFKASINGLGYILLERTR